MGRFALKCWKWNFHNAESIFSCYLDAIKRPFVFRVCPLAKPWTTHFFLTLRNGKGIMPLSRLRKRKYLKSKILPFYQSLSYTKQEIGVGFLIPTSTKKNNNNFEIHLALLHFLSIYFGRTCTDSNCSESLQKVKHNIVNTCNYPYCDALWKLYIVCIRFHQLFEMSWCIYWKVQLLVVLVNWQ